MDPILFVIPVALFIVAGGVVFFLNKRGKQSVGVAQEAMKKFVCEQIPAMNGTSFGVISLADVMATTPHIWVIAFNESGMHIIPTTPNPFNQSFKLYEDLTPTTNLKKQIAAQILSGNKTETIDYVPFSAITNVAIDEGKRKITI